MANKTLDWPMAEDIQSDSARPVALGKVIDSFEALEKAALLISIGKTEYNNKVSWYGIYYSEEWQGVKKVYATSTLMDHLTAHGQEMLPAFCAYKEKQTKSKNVFYEGSFQTVPKDKISLLRAVVPQTVWEVAMAEKADFNLKTL